MRALIPDVLIENVELQGQVGGPLVAVVTLVVTVSDTDIAEAVEQLKLAEPPFATALFYTKGDGPDAPIEVTSETWIEEPRNYLPPRASR